MGLFCRDFKCMWGGVGLWSEGVCGIWVWGVRVGGKRDIFDSNFIESFGCMNRIFFCYALYIENDAGVCFWAIYVHC